MSDDEPELRRCGRCQQLKPHAEFAWRRRRRNQLDNMCRLCRAEYHRKHYLANKQRYIDQAQVRKEILRAERTEYLFDYFAAHPCKDCGESDPVVLEFDHLDAATKSFNIGAGLTYRAWDSILEEIEKCEVVCANCHRRRTAQRRGSFRAQLVEEAKRELSGEAGEQAADGNRTRVIALEGRGSTVELPPRARIRPAGPFGVDDSLHKRRRTLQSHRARTARCSSEDPWRC